MAKTRRQEGETGERGPSYGIAAITRSFQGVDFPADKHALIEKIKHKPEVHWSKDIVLDLREILESLPEGNVSGITELTHLMNERIHAKSPG